MSLFQLKELWQWKNDWSPKVRIKNLLKRWGKFNNKMMKK